MRLIRFVLIFLAGCSMLVTPCLARRADTRSFDHFGHKECTTNSCREKHPSGSYTFPYHEGSRR